MSKSPWFPLLRHFLGKDRMEKEMGEELQFHLECQIRNNIKNGMTPRQARRDALISFGGVEQTREDCREALGFRILNELQQDFRYAIHRLIHSPGFTFITVSILALGIGANTAVFSILDQLVFRPLPVFEPGRLAQIKDSASYLDYLDIRKDDHVFSDAAAMFIFPFDVLDSDWSESLSAKAVSANFFKVLGIRPAAGRFFRPEEDSLHGSSPVAVISYRLWQRRFGSDPAVVGKTMRLQGEPVTIAGVAPKRFRDLDYDGAPRDIWMTLPSFQQVMHLENDPIMSDVFEQRNKRALYVIGRMKPGIPLQQAQARMDVISEQLRRAYPDSRRSWGRNIDASFTEEGWEISLSTLDKPRTLSGSTVLSLNILFAAAGLILLICCANVGSLFLARGAARRREIATRMAIGANRFRILRRLLTECLVLSSISLAASFLVWRLVLQYVPRLEGPLGGWNWNPGDLEIAFDLRVFAIAASIALLANLIFALVPAFLGSRVDLVSSLEEQGFRHSGAGPRGRRILVVAQVALAFVLLVGAGLFIRIIARFESADPGFNTNVLIANPDQPDYGSDNDRYTAFRRRILERVRALPGVVDAAWASDVPPELGSSLQGFNFATSGPGSDEVQWIASNAVSPGYFSALQIPIVRGRDFTRAEDTVGSAGVIIVNETMARRFWPGENPLGKLVRIARRLGDSRKNPDLVYEIIGVVRDAGYSKVWGGAGPYAYFTMAHLGLNGRLHVRAAGNMSPLIKPVRRIFEAPDIDCRLRDLKPISADIQGMTSRERSTAYLLSIFGGLALLLACIGLYGVLSYSVAQRSREFGIRMALGARHGNIIQTVVREGVFTVLAGLAVGLPCSMVLTRFLVSRLHGLSPLDPFSYVSVCVLWICMSIPAALLPARKAFRNPMKALRVE